MSHTCSIGERSDDLAGTKTDRFSVKHVELQQQYAGDRYRVGNNLLVNCSGMAENNSLNQKTDV